QSLYLVQADTGSEQISSVTVAHIVIADPPKFGRFEHAKKRPPKVARVQVTAGWSRKKVPFHHVLNHLVCLSPIGGRLFHFLPKRCCFLAGNQLREYFF